MAGPLLFLHAILSSPHPSLLPHLPSPPLPLNPILASHSRCPPTFTRTPKAQLLIKPSPHAHAQRDRSVSLLAIQQLQVFFLLVPGSKTASFELLVWRAAGSFSGGFRFAPLPTGRSVLRVGGKKTLSHPCTKPLILFTPKLSASRRKRWTNSSP